MTGGSDILKGKIFELQAFQIAQSIGKLTEVELIVDLHLFFDLFDEDVTGHFRCIDGPEERPLLFENPAQLPFDIQPLQRNLDLHSPDDLKDFDRIGLDTQREKSIVESSYLELSTIFFADSFFQVRPHPRLIEIDDQKRGDQQYHQRAEYDPADDEESLQFLFHKTNSIRPIFLK